jgi:hypothetical protein
MALTHTYNDAYLKTRITEDIETRAAADVADYGEFPDEWTDKLEILRAYILACLELGGKSDDTFSAKLKQYRDEWKEALPMAKRAQQLADPTVTLPIFSIPIERA